MLECLLEHDGGARISDGMTALVAASYTIKERLEQLR
jgi:hypothetical protein